MKQFNIHSVTVIIPNYMSMNEKKILRKLRDSIVELDFDHIKLIAREAVESGIPAFKAITRGMAAGMDIVGKKFERGEYFLSELLVAGQVMNEGMSVLEPHLEIEDIETSGKVVVGTVRGDLHDIGKNIFINLLRSAGFEAVDLGVDVPAERFVEAVRDERPDVLGLSSLLSTCHAEIATIIGALEKAGLRDNVKVVVGGATLTDEIAKNLGADVRAKDAVDGVRISNRWVRGAED